MKCGVILKITLLVLISASFSDQQKWTNALNVIPTNNVRVFKRNAVPISSSTTTKSMAMPEIRITENKQIESPKLKKRKKSDDRKNDRVMNLKETPKTTAKYEVTLSDEMLTVLSDKPEMYKSRSNIEIIPKEEKHKEKTAIKRNPKDIGRKIEEVESESVTEDSDVGHGKPNLLKGLKRTRPGNSETVLGEAKPVKQLKPLILPRKQMTIINSCASPAIKMQIEIVKDRLFKLIERMDKTAVNCASLNTEIETIRTLLQQAMHKTPEGRHRDVDRSKILDQLRERQAKIHARFGRLELIKPKHSLVGDVKVESETQIKEKDQEQAT